MVRLPDVSASERESWRRDERASLRFRLLLGVAVLSAGFAASTPAWSPFGAPVWGLFVVRILAGLSMIGCGLIAARRPSGRRIGELMLAAAAVYFVPFVGMIPGALPFTIEAVSWYWYVAFFVHAIVAFPTDRLETRLQLGVVALAYASIIGSRIVVIFAWHPEEDGCGPLQGLQPHHEADCPRNLLRVFESPRVYETLLAAQTVPYVVTILLVATVLLKRWQGATVPERRVFVAVYAAWVAIVVVASVREVVWQVASVRAFEVISYLEAVSLMLVAIAFAFGVLRTALGRAAVGDLVMRVSGSPTPAELEQHIIVALGDPTARLARRPSPTSGFRDVHDAPLEPPRDSSRALTAIEGSDGPLGAIIHDSSLIRDQPALLASVAAAGRLALENQRLQAEVRLTRQVPAGLAERLLREGRRIGETETLTVTTLMSDIRGYSTLAEHADPHVLAGQLLEHRRIMSHAITQHGGTVMQYVGDAVFAVFGAPLTKQDHAASAVRAALEMHQLQSRLDGEWLPKGLPHFGLGIGLTSGDVAAALLGSEDHLEYSVVGDSVNLAARLQQWAGAGEVVMDAATYHSGCPDLAAEPLPLATVKGRSTPVEAYRVVLLTPGPTMPA